MKIIENITINGYRNIRSMTLTPFSDLNIFIGPNNSGKSTILKCIRKLSDIDTSTMRNFLDPNQEKVKNKWNSILQVPGSMTSMAIPITNEERFNRIEKISLYFGFNKEVIEHRLHEIYQMTSLDMVMKFLQWEKRSLNDVPTELNRLVEQGWYSLELNAKENNNLLMEKFSVLSFLKLTDSIKDKIIFCDDTRLQYYNGVLIQDHIFNKAFDDGQYGILKSWLQKIIDAKIINYLPTLKKIRTVSGVNTTIDVTMEELGSGVRSLICLIADIIAAPKGSIILIDEPELGLNPSAKHHFINFLNDQAKEKQIFFSTHDPTFTNPILWKRETPPTQRSIFLFSHIKNEFINVNLDINKDTAGSFGGYLPHTTSSKEMHIYVEGKTDVQNFKCFFEKYLWGKNKWIQWEDKIGIYYLGGNFWHHLIYTIPQFPYKRIVILDGDKRSDLDIINPNEKLSLRDRITEIYGDKIVFCNESNLDSNHKHYNSDIAKFFNSGEKTLIYTLTENNIEEYLKDKPKGKNNGPIKAHEMEFKDIPAELIRIFDLVTT